MTFRKFGAFSLTAEVIYCQKLSFIVSHQFNDNQMTINDYKITL